MRHAGTGILTVSAALATVDQGVALLGLYAAGLGMPFLAAAAFSGGLARRLRSLRRAGAWLHGAAGAAMVAMGVLMMTGELTTMSYWLIESFPVLGRIG